MTRRTAVSMTEVLVAIVLLAIILFPIWASFRQSVEIIQMGHRDLEVLDLGASFLSQVRDIKGNGIIEGRNIPLEIKNSRTYHLFQIPIATWTIDIANKVNIELAPWEPKSCKVSVSFENFPFDPADQMGVTAKIARLTVSWSEKTGEEKTRRFSTLIFDR